MKISILTLFPEMFVGVFDHSIIKRAKEKGLVEIEFINIRDFGIGKHKMVDDTAYGGGVGMVMRVDVVHQAIEFAKKKYSSNENQEILSSPTRSGIHRIDSRLHHKGTTYFIGSRGNDKSIKQKIILLTASGQPFTQSKAQTFSKLDHLILICGHYEGIDDRIKNFIDGELSIGDFVLTGGEIPTMLIADAVTRLIPGVLPEKATEEESFSLSAEGKRLLEYPHFTKPPVYENHKVPEVLLSGNHKKIETWRAEEAVKKTKAVRPDLTK